MNATLSLPPDTDIDTQMRLVARNLAQGLYELSKILEFCNVPLREFNRWKEHPRFLALLKSEREAWNAASNTAERTKLKAGIAMEEWILDAYGELKDRKQPLNHRMEMAVVGEVSPYRSTSPPAMRPPSTPAKSSRTLTTPLWRTYRSSAG